TGAGLAARVGAGRTGAGRSGAARAARAGRARAAARRGLAALFVLHRVVRGLRQLQVVLQRGQGARRERLELAVLAGLRFLLEFRHVLLVVRDHALHVGAVEVGARQLLQLVHVGLVLLVERGRQLDALRARGLLALLV